MSNFTGKGLIGCLAVFVVASGFATRLPLRIYTTADGLARDAVNCIVPDARGFLWLCTAEGLKVPKRQTKRGRLWLNDGSCVRLRPTHRNHVWSYDFVADRTHDSRPIKMLTVIDEYSRECLAIVTERN